MTLLASWRLTVRPLRSFQVCIWYKELHTIDDFAIDGCESVKVVIPDAIVLTGAVSVRPPYPLGGFIRFRGTYSYTTSSKCMLFGASRDGGLVAGCHDRLTPPRRGGIPNTRAGSPAKPHKKLDLQRFDLDMECALRWSCVTASAANLTWLHTPDLTPAACACWSHRLWPRQWVHWILRLAVEAWMYVQRCTLVTLHELTTPPHALLKHSHGNLHQ